MASDNWLVPAPFRQVHRGQAGRVKPLVLKVPKSLVRLATRRNQIKRLVREAFRQNPLIQPGRIYCFRVIKKPATLTLADVQRQIHEALQDDFK